VSSRSKDRRTRAKGKRKTVYGSEPDVGGIGRMQTLYLDEGRKGRAKKRIKEKDFRCRCEEKVVTRKSVEE